MEANKVFLLPEHLLLEIFSQWITLKDFSQLDIALCNSKSRNSFLSFLTYNPLEIKSSRLNLSLQSPMYYPPTKIFNEKFGLETMTYKERKNNFLPIKYCAKRNIQIQTVVLKTWPFFELEPEDWKLFLRSVSTLSLSIEDSLHTISSHGWGSYLSEFRSFSAVKNLELTLNDRQEGVVERVYLLDLLLAAKILWKDPLQSLSISTQKGNEYGYDKLSIRPGAMLSTIIDYSVFSNLRSLKLVGSEVFFSRNSNYLNFISLFASFENCLLEELVLDIDATYKYRSQRACRFIVQNMEQLLSKPASQRSGFQRLISIEGADAFVYPILFMTAKLENVRLYISDKLLIGWARHLPRLPHENVLPYHVDDENDQVDGEEDDYEEEDDFEDDQSDVVAPLPEDTAQADNGNPWALPHLPHVKSLFLVADARSEAVRHLSIPFVVGPFLKNLGCFSVLETLLIRLSLSVDITRTDMIDFFESVIEDRADGLLPSDTFHRLKKLEIADFVYLRSLQDPEVVSLPYPLPEGKTARDIDPTVLLPEEDHTLARTVARLCPFLEAWDYHPERDRDDTLYHRRRFRVSSILPLAATLKSLHVDEVFRIMVPRRPLYNELSQFAAFSNLLHLTLRDSGFYFSDAALLPILQSLPRLITLVMSVDDYLQSAIEEGNEKRNENQHEAAIDDGDEENNAYRGHPKEEIVCSSNPCGYITTALLQHIAEHNQQLRVLILDVPCLPLQDSIDQLTEKLKEISFFEQAESSQTANEATVEKKVRSPSSIFVASLFYLWLNLRLVKTRQHLYVRMDNLPYGPNLWNKTKSSEGRRELTEMRSERWRFRQNIRTRLLRSYDQLKTTYSQVHRKFTLEVMTSPLNIYRYDSRSGTDFLKEYLSSLESPSAPVNEDDEFYASAQASSLQEEPEYDDDVRSSVNEDSEDEHSNDSNSSNEDEGEDDEGEDGGRVDDDDDDDDGSYWSDEDDE